MFSMLYSPKSFQEKREDRVSLVYAFLFSAHTGLAIMPPLRRQECLLFYIENVSAQAGLAKDT